MAETTKKHDRIAELKNVLGKGLYEKDEALRLAILAAIAGESIFFLGAPGCAKSMLARLVVRVNSFLKNMLIRAVPCTARRRILQKR